MPVFAAIYIAVLPIYYLRGYVVTVLDWYENSASSHHVSPKLAGQLSRRTKLAVAEFAVKIIRCIKYFIVITQFFRKKMHAVLILVEDGQCKLTTANEGEIVLQSNQTQKSPFSVVRSLIQKDIIFLSNRNSANSIAHEFNLTSQLHRRSSNADRERSCNKRRRKLKTAHQASTRKRASRHSSHLS